MNEVQKVEPIKTEEKTVEMPNTLDRKIIIHWGGEVDPDGFISPYDIVGYIHIYFNQENFNALKKLIDGMNFVNKNTNPTKKQIVLHNGEWRVEGFDTKEEAYGFLLQSFSPQSIHAMILQALNTVPIALRKVKEIDMIYKAINDIFARLDSIDKKLAEANKTV